HRPVSTRVTELMKPLPVQRIGNLIVVLQKSYEGPRWNIARGSTTMLLLPLAPLALIQIAVFAGRHQLLRAAQVVRIIRLIMARQRDQRRVMEVVIPQTVQAIAAALRRSNELR